MNSIISSPLIKKKKTILCNGKLLDLSIPKVMGIINLTPDSFYAGSRLLDNDNLLDIVENMLIDGASIIDLGGVSTRPGAAMPDEKEELSRLLPSIKKLIKHFPEIILSIDTYRSSIAEAVIGEGAAMINDISAGTLDPKLFETIARLQVPYVLMHIQGSPENMQKSPHYTNVVNDIFSFFAAKLSLLKKLGVNDVLLDPGFGFGKTIEHNYELLQRMDEFKIFELPVLAGISRKSMIYKPLNSTPEQALNGTTVANTIALIHGASILRVHDVKEAVEAIAIVEKLKGF